MSVYAIVLAAGKGTRMDSDLAKVLHVAAGRTLLDWSLAALSEVDVESIAVVVGHQAAAVTASIADHELAPLVATALQSEQLGTGHAAKVGLGALRTRPDDVVLVMSGDMPLLRPATLRALADTHVRSEAAATVLTAVIDDPTGYGRIKRNASGVEAIVEEADASSEEAKIAEVNTSVYAFDAGPLADCLETLDTDNAQGEQYLTDVVGTLARRGMTVAAVQVEPIEASGVNTIEQLASAAEVLELRLK